MALTLTLLQGGGQRRPDLDRARTALRVRTAQEQMAARALAEATRRRVMAEEELAALEAPAMAPREGA